MAGQMIAAFFDLDLTITDCDTFRLFLKKFYCNHGLDSIYLPYIFFFGILRKLRFVSLQTFKEQSLIALRNKSQEDISAIGNLFFEQHASRVLRPMAISRIKFHKERGHLVFIVSAAPDIYLKWISRYLECDGYSCTRLQYRNNKFTGLFDGRDCLGEEKVQHVKKIVAKHNIDLERSVAYSDHESDIALLGMTGRPVAVSPSRKLFKIATQNAWDIMKW